MKLKFKNQDFQISAVNAVADLFTGQKRNHATFFVDIAQQAQIELCTGGTTVC